MKLPDSYSHTLACAIRERELITVTYLQTVVVGSGKKRHEEQVMSAYRMVVGRAG